MHRRSGDGRRFLHDDSQFRSVLVRPRHAPPGRTAGVVESLRQQIQTGFTSFATSGEPRPVAASGEALPPWPSYNAETDRHISLKSTSVASAGLSKADCDFLGSIGLVQ